MGTRCEIIYEASIITPHVHQHTPVQWLREEQSAWRMSKPSPLSPAYMRPLMSFWIIRICQKAFGTDYHRLLPKQKLL